MYLTFYKHPQIELPSLEDLLKNPFISYKDLKNTEIKKVTIPITEEYGQKLYNKNPFNLYRIPDFILDEELKDHYRFFEIPKRSNPNKKRQIWAPDERLERIQRYLLNNLESLNILPHKAAYAYVKNRSTVNALEKHQKNKSHWYLQIDLKNFFPSITEKMLREQLIKVYPFKYLPEWFFNDIIKYALLNGTMPQGTCLSPVLSNLIMVEFDYKLNEKLVNYNKHHYVYTRYADDITISCKETFNKDEIIKLIEDTFKECELELEINHSKTRYNSRAGINYHLGLIINKDNEISVGHEKNNKFRAMIYNFCTVGEQWEKHDIQKMLGLISYYKSIEPDFIKSTLEKYNKKFNIDIMQKAKHLLNN